uniref:Uncharacterized protein n=1 Tax=Cyprinodon variegatus TaxID=28743 RepID=A0A3Q2CCW8_CYPVA
THMNDPATYSQLYPVSDYMGYSIFIMLCCCLPLGIAALVNSIATHNANSRGDRMAAEQSSKYAQILNHVGLGIGIVFYVTAIIIVVVLYTIILQS